MDAFHCISKMSMVNMAYEVNPRGCLPCKRKKMITFLFFHLPDEA